VLLRAWTKSDPRGEALAALLPFKSELKSVNVDTVGIGEYFAKHLSDHKLPVKEINVGKAARDPEKYSNLKAEVYWGFRLRAANGDLAGLTDDRAIAQLAGIRYSHNSRGQIVIESKAEARKRGVKSPDRAEAVILAFIDLAVVSGVLEYYRQECEKLAALNPNRNRPCGRCGAPSVARFGTFLVCRVCSAMIASGESPSCPGCKSTAIGRIGAELRCQRCGKQFGDQKAN
jgi:ribosomal protein L37AE/L43A